jgi:hypothetical protein
LKVPLAAISSLFLVDRARWNPPGGADGEIRSKSDNLSQITMLVFSGSPAASIHLGRNRASPSMGKIKIRCKSDGDDRGGFRALGGCAFRALTTSRGKLGAGFPFKVWGWALTGSPFSVTYSGRARAGHGQGTCITIQPNLNPTDQLQLIEAHGRWLEILEMYTEYTTWTTASGTSFESDDDPRPYPNPRQISSLPDAEHRVLQNLEGEAPRGLITRPIAELAEP